MLSHRCALHGVSQERFPQFRPVRSDERNNGKCVSVEGATQLLSVDCTLLLKMLPAVTQFSP